MTDQLEEVPSAPADRTTQREELDSIPHEVLTVPEVAKLLRLHTNTVYAMAARGELPRKPMGRLVRFTKAGLRRYLDS